MTLRLTGDLATAKALMHEVASYTEQHFGDSVTFDPFIDVATGRVVWLNVASDEDALVRWEQDMGERTGFRIRVREVLEPVGTDLLDPVADQRLDRLRSASTIMSSMLD